MAITTDKYSGNFIRTDQWANRIQEELLEELMAQSMVTWIQDEFPDGEKIKIPVLSRLSAQDYEENTNIAIQDPNVDLFELTIDEYRQAGIGITDKMKEDTFYMNVLTSKFPAQCVRALMDRLENDIFLLHKKQTNNDANVINGIPHRFAATGTANTTNDSMTIADIAQAKLALDKANVSKNGRFAVVDPQVAYQLTSLDQVIRQDVYGANSVIKEGFGGTSYIGRYMGFDFYESNMLDEATALDYETGGAQIANIFAGEEAFVGAIRTMPDIESSRDWEKRRDIYHAVTRYGLGLYRPESLVTVLTGIYS